MVKHKDKSPRKDPRDLGGKDLDLVLIIGATLCVLIIANFVTSKHKSFKPLHSSGVAVDGMNTTSDISNDQPPQALIAHLPEPTLGAATEIPAGQQQAESESVALDSVVEFGPVAPKSDVSTTVYSHLEASGEFSTNRARRQREFLEQRLHLNKLMSLMGIRSGLKDSHCAMFKDGDRESVLAQTIQHLLYFLPLIIALGASCQWLICAAIVLITIHMRQTSGLQVDTSLPRIPSVRFWDSMYFGIGGKDVWAVINKWGLDWRC